MIKEIDNYGLGVVKTDNGFKFHVFCIIDVKDIKYEKQKYF